MKKFTSILATALIAASLFLSSPFPASGDNSLTKIIRFQKTDPSTRSISDADLPEASIRNDELSVSFDDSGMYSLYIEDNFGVTVYTSALPANGMEYDYDLSGIGDGLFRLVLSGSSGEYEGYFSIN